MERFPYSDVKQPEWFHTLNSRYRNSQRGFTWAIDMLEQKLSADSARSNWRPACVRVGSSENGRARPSFSPGMARGLSRVAERLPVPRGHKPRTISSNQWWPWCRTPNRTRSSFSFSFSAGIERRQKIAENHDESRHVFRQAPPATSPRTNRPAFPSLTPPPRADSFPSADTPLHPSD